LRYKIFINELEKLNNYERNRVLQWMGVVLVETRDPNQLFEVGLEKIDNPQRFHWSNCVIYTDNDTGSLFSTFQLFLNENKDLQEVVIEGTGPVSRRDCSETLDAKIQVLLDEPHRIVVNISAKNDGWLVIADTWDPGWYVKIDDNFGELFHANYLFKAIPINAGDHTVVLGYSSIWFLAGAVLSTLSMMIIALLGCMVFLDKKL
jgi:hypothetical protein